MQKNFLCSSLNYCKTLLSGSPNKILNACEVIKKAAAHVLTRTSIKDHISLVSASLYWFPVQFRTEFKILLPNGSAPSYLKECLVPYHLIRSLCTQSDGLSVVPRVSKSRMSQSFKVTKLLFCEIISQSQSGGQITCLRGGLQHLFLINLKVRNGSD